MKDLSGTCLKGFTRLFKKLVCDSFYIVLFSACIFVLFTGVGYIAVNLDILGITWFPRSIAISLLNVDKPPLKKPQWLERH